MAHLASGTIKLRKKKYRYRLVRAGNSHPDYVLTSISFALFASRLVLASLASPLAQSLRTGRGIAL